MDGGKEIYYFIEVNFICWLWEEDCGKVGDRSDDKYKSFSLSLSLNCKVLSSSKTNQSNWLPTQPSSLAIDCKDTVERWLSFTQTIWQNLTFSP